MDEPKKEKRTPARRDLLGSLLGLAVFVGGLTILWFVFTQAKELFDMPARKALGISSGKTLDFNDVGIQALGVVIRMLTLLVMSVVGSVVANRGITMFVESRRTPK